MSSNVWLVVPCYNEQEVLNTTAAALKDKLDEMISDGIASPCSRILFIDDGSSDKTWDIISTLSNENEVFTGLKLSRNRGHQNALLAGLMYSKDKCDCAISLDADLQDDISVLPEFVKKYQEGCEVVYGVRNSRKTDTFFKRSTAVMFYKLMNWLGAKTVYNHADYRLLGSRALNELAEFKEVNLFLRGIVPLIGFRSDYVYYERQVRAAGVSKYPLKKMIAFAFDGITSFSVKPLKLISWLGGLFSFVSVAGIIYALISFFTGNAVPGWTAMICAVFLIGGIQLLCIGVLGEYIGKMYSEIKGRPRYIIDEISEHKKDK